jgi:hypothetical protein
MPDNRTNIDPRYLSYDKDEVEELLDKVAAQKIAQEEDIRAIVSEYQGV